MLQRPLVRSLCGSCGSCHVPVVHTGIVSTTTHVFLHRRPTPPVCASRVATALLLAMTLDATLAQHACAQAGVRREVSTATGSEGERWVRESWTVRDGLPVNSINKLIQSRDGYIWAATFDGLVRFDGVRFAVFNTANTPGLPSNRIVDVQELRDGTLWMRTEQLDLVRFDRERAVVIRRADGARLAVNRFVQDAAGTIWVGSDGGVGVVRGDVFSPVAADSIRDAVYGVLPTDDGGALVASSRSEMWRVSAGRPARRLVFSGGLASPPLRDDAAPMYRTASGEVVVGLRYQLWIGRDTLRPIRPAPAGGFTALGFQRSTSTGALWIYGVTHVGRLTSSGLEFVTRQQRTFIYPALWNDASGMWYGSGNKVYREGNLVHTIEPAGTSLDPIEITTILVDREGSVWFGTQSAGLHRLTRSLFRAFGVPEGSGSNNIYPIVETNDGIVWLGTWGKGLTRVDPVAGVARSFGPEVRSFALVQSIIDDGDDTLLISGEGGVRRCTTVPTVRCSAIADSVVATAHVSAFFRDDDGRVWAGAREGLFRRTGATWERVAGAPQAAVRAAARTRDGALWMATNGAGLARYKDGRFIPVTTADGLPTDVIRSLYVDEDGWLWVGTEGRGLVRIDPREWTTPATTAPRHIVHIGTAEGLYDDVVHQILDDGAGQLWMSSNRGIFRIARQELLSFADGRATHVSSVAYTERDGLRNREANGGYFPAGVRARDGRLWFPTQAGAVVVDPRRVGRSAVAPPIVVERVVTRGRALAATAPITLAADERDLEVQYTAPTFLEPANQRFRYRLLPYDVDWVDAGTRRTAFYTRVPAGRYTFQVQVADGRGGWHEATASQQVTIAPRWYETWPARLAALLLSGSALVLGARWRVRRLRERAAALEQQVDARTAELREKQQELAASNTRLAEQASALAELSGARSRMFANLSHEFRTPLTLILGPLQGMLEGRYGELPGEVRDAHGLMQRNAQRLLRLINQILDLARLQGGAMAIERREQDLVAFTQGVVRAFGDLAQRRGVALSMASSQAAIPLAFDGGHIEKVLLNLLSNALKFTPQGGRVDVTVTREGSEAVVAVRDTGVGIAATELPHVFERFYQADASSTRQFEGSGIGLALARELVELHGGTIGVTSVPDGGSTFTVRLPMHAAATASATQPLPDTLAQATAAAVANQVTAQDSAAEWSGEQVGVAVPEEAPLVRADLREDRTTVLVVDDNADVRAYVRSVLSAAYRVLQAPDGESGLAVAQRDLPDLVVADLMMPGMDGLAFGRALRSDPLTDVIPIVLLTARADSEMQVAGYESGADAYLTKPFEPEVLEACVAGLLAQRRRLKARYAGTAAPDTAPATARADEADGAPDGVGAAVASRPVGQTAIERTLRPLVLARLHDDGLSPASLAEAAGLSYHQMYRALQVEADTTPSKFIRGVRAERGAELLRSGAGTVAEVAYAVGFESLSYFSRAFKERFGASPVTFLPGRGERAS